MAGEPHEITNSRKIQTRHGKSELERKVRAAATSQAERQMKMKMHEETNTKDRGTPIQVNELQTKSFKAPKRQRTKLNGEKK